MYFCLVSPTYWKEKCNPCTFFLLVQPTCEISSSLHFFFTFARVTAKKKVHRLRFFPYVGYSKKKKKKREYPVTADTVLAHTIC